ncbi:hypothetical protein FQN57_007184 [Myotisia sp. PD_48]|nr:hypothetical protein FQN57_007184 [Myotisia sp. PD_48]
MSPQLVPQNPEAVMVIRTVCENVVTCSVPFDRYGLIKFGGRATIVRLKSGSLVIFSPVALTQSVRDTIENLQGTVKYIIAPDLEHHIFLGEWKEAYPEVEIIAPEGLKEKREKDPKTKGVPIDYIFTAENKNSLVISPEFEAEFDIEYIYAHPSREIVTYHRPTGTLIQADLWFNPPAKEQYQKTKEGPSRGIWTKMFNAVMTTQGGQRRFIWYVLSGDNREAFKQSIVRIYGWDFDRMIPCHGDTVENGAKQQFRSLFEWFLLGQ